MAQIFRDFDINRHWYSTSISPFKAVLLVNPEKQRKHQKAEWNIHANVIHFVACLFAEMVERIKRRSITFWWIYLWGKKQTFSQFIAKRSVVAPTVNVSRAVNSLSIAITPSILITVHKRITVATTHNDWNGNGKDSAVVGPTVVASWNVHSYSIERRKP
jgi:hypothetical protein